jgi:phosphoribosylamine--glycine ligase
MMKVLVIGSGGREHAIAWKLAQSRLVSEVYVAPGNGGIATEHKCYCVPYTSHQALAHFVEQNQISLTIVGPEQPLANGIVDYFKKKHLPIFGPHQKAAQLETSKIFAKKFMTKYHIPTAKYKIFHEIKTAIVYLKNACYPVVIKVDGLAAGKGVVIANNFIQAKQLITDLQVNGIFSNGAKRLVIESYLEGYEASFICMTDQRTIVPLISAKDHKRAYDHDDGPNTGGMGVIAPNPHCTKHDLQAFITEILNPTLHGLQKANLNYQGFLFFGVMFTKNGPMLLEYNVRMGDPETQAILPLMDSDFLRVIMWCMTNQLRYHHIK